MSEVLLKGGASVAGYPVAVLHINSRYPLPPGNVQHAQTFDFPVLYEAVAVDDPYTLMQGDDSLLPAIEDACQRAVAKGVRVIVGACGSFAFYQKAIADRVEVPVFLSVLTQIPFILQGLGSKKLGVIAASVVSMNEKLYTACSIDAPERLAITDMQSSAEFRRMLQQDHPLDTDVIEADLCRVAGELLDMHGDIGAILLQCSDLPPFAAALQARTNLPVFDAVTLVNMAYRSAYYPAFSGYRRTH